MGLLDTTVVQLFASKAISSDTLSSGEAAEIRRMIQLARRQLCFGVSLGLREYPSIACQVNRSHLTGLTFGKPLILAPLPCQ
jgi:hypothetical protein